MSAHTATRGRVPPMLDVAFAELVRGGAQQMLAGQRRLSVDQRHHILQLIAETISAAGLIKSAAPPKPAAQRLVQKPAISHQVDRWVGGFDVQGAERAVPITPN